MHNCYRNTDFCRKMSDITREEWIDFDWVEYTSLGDSERMYVRSLMSPPLERAKKIKLYEYIDRENKRREAE